MFPLILFPFSLVCFHSLYSYFLQLVYTHPNHIFFCLFPSILFPFSLFYFHPCYSHFLWFVSIHPNPIFFRLFPAIPFPFSLLLQFQLTERPFSSHLLLLSLFLSLPIRSRLLPLPSLPPSATPLPSAIFTFHATHVPKRYPTIFNFVNYSFQLPRFT